MTDSGDTSSDTKSGSGEKHMKVDVDVDPVAIENLISSHPSGTHDAKEEAKTGKASHDISIDVSGMTWGEVKSALGTTDFLSGGKVSLTPAEGKNPLQSDVHLDLIKQHWADLGGVQLVTGIGGDLEYTDHKGMSEKLELTQDVKFKAATLYGKVETDFGSGSPQVSASVGLKFEF